MRSSTPSRALWLSLAMLMAATLACRQKSPPPLSQLPQYQPEYGEGFSAQRCWRDLEALSAIGPRVTGTEGSQRAREYIRDQLSAAGLEVETKEIRVRQDQGEGEGEGEDPLVVTNLWTTIPGQSDDLVVLAAPYDTRPFESFEFIGANDGASGVALLLELARNLAENPLHYTTRIVFLDGEAARPDRRAEGEELQLLGSTDLAAEMAEQGLLARTRLLVIFNKVADADLRVARDLYSHRLYREEFWSAAARLGYTKAFPPQHGFESVAGSHHPFRSAGLGRVVAIVDTSYGGEEQPGVYANSEEDRPEHLSADSLRIVGEVTLDALDSLSDRLARIDRFSKAPLAEPEEREPAAPVAPEEREPAAPVAPEEPAARSSADNPYASEAPAVESPDVGSPGGTDGAGAAVAPAAEDGAPMPEATSPEPQL